MPTTDIDASGPTPDASAPLGRLHHDTYFGRMRAGLDDKAQLLDHLAPGTVLDVGAGDGSLVRLLRDHGWDATGLDASAAAVARADGLVVLGEARELESRFPAGSFDNVVFCSSLHEIWSYAGGREAWIDAVRQAAELLAPGGRLLIRDGVAPAEPAATWQLTLSDPADGFAFFDQWREPAVALLGQVGVVRDGDALVGPAGQLAEFLFTYGWGWESLPREGAELYTAAGSHARCSRRVARATGLTPQFSRAYLQPGYRRQFDQLGRLAARADDGSLRPQPWPNSNAIWVFGRS